MLTLLHRESSGAEVQVKEGLPEPVQMSEGAAVAP